MTLSILVSLLALFSPHATPEAQASQVSCLDQTLFYRNTAPNQSHLSPTLDKQNAIYQCSVTGARGLSLQYLSSVAMLTQRSSGYCLPWNMASYQTFTLLDRAYYLGLNAARELQQHRACIDWLRTGYQSAPTSAAFSCFHAQLTDKIPALRACLAGQETMDSDAGRAAVYACHALLFGDRESCGPDCR